MFGRCCCAPAGAEAIVAAKTEVSKAGNSFLRIELLMFQLSFPKRSEHQV